MTTAAALNSVLTAEIPQTISRRHTIHANPELMFEEAETSKLVQQELSEAGIAFVAGLARGNGVLAYLPATTDESRAKTIGLRADMDALPILEATGKEYASRNEGVMHACGHDAHTANLVGVAKVLKQTEHRPNNVMFIFQPAEEGGAGGDLMVKDGALDGSRIGKPVDMLFGLHGWPGIKLNQLSSKPGPLLAATDEFSVTLLGHGGHAAMPHVLSDPVVAAAQVVTALQSIVSRNNDPVDGMVISVTDISTPNDANNIIPHSSTIKGTIRTLSDNGREVAVKRFHEVVQGVAGAMGCIAEFDFEPGYPVTENDADAYNHWREVMSGTFAAGTIEETPAPFMGGEDFSFYCKEVPSCFFLVGLQPDGDPPYPGLHTPEFDFNDDAMSVAMLSFCALALAE
ncbi:MAG: amidohydrolase [Planctomycetota bacterium]